MRLTAITMLVLAVALGAVSVYLARDWLEQQSQAARSTEPKIELTKIVVAKRPMNFGDTVTAEYLTEIDWPAATTPPGSFTSIDDLTKADEPRVVLRAIQVNEPVLDSKLSGAGGKATMSTILESDKRAVTIRVNDVNGVAGFVLPGDRVDVLLTRDENPNGRGHNPITDILLQNVKVLGIDQKANDDEDKPKVARAVTLEVVPYDAQKLALASTVGSLSLALRNQADADADFTKTVRISDLRAKAFIEVEEETKEPKVKKTVAEPADKPAAPVVKKVKRIYVSPPNPYSNVTVVRGTASSTSKVLKDENKESESAPITASRTAPLAPSRSTPEAESPATPKIIVPEG